MAALTESSTFQSLVTETVKSNGNSITASNMAADSSYWFRTSGRDLSNMMREANFPDEAQRQFLKFHRDTICPQLGGRPEPNSLRTAVGWDGNPFEYSLEFKESTKSAGVRFVVDLSQLRPGDKVNPLGIANSQKVLDTMAPNTVLYDDRWHRSLNQFFVYDHVSTNEQKALIAKAGYQTSIILGFDINPRILELAPGKLPVMAKSYFPPCFVANAKGIDRWQALSLGIRQLPDIYSHPNVLRALTLIEEYLMENPHYREGARGLSTDLVDPGKARLKIYMRYGADDFAEVWDYYTLGGRIPDLEEDKEMFRDLMDLTNGDGYTNGESKKIDPLREATLRRKPIAIYFSLSPEKPYPIPKVYFYPARKAANDKAIAQGLDTWLTKYGWHEGGKSVEERVGNIFTHRKLEDNLGMFTFVGLGRKEDPSKKGLSLQVYLTGELYETPRY